MLRDIFVRTIRLPDAIRAVTIPNNDCTFDVYVNDCLPEELQQQALDHELTHIRRNHFYNTDPVQQNEQEAQRASPQWRSDTAPVDHRLWGPLGDGLPR